MRKPHKHAEIIKAWADGAEIEWKDLEAGIWRPNNSPLWAEDEEYRIKPESKPDVVLYRKVGPIQGDKFFSVHGYAEDNLKLTFDGETGKLKSAEVLK